MEKFKTIMEQGVTLRATLALFDETINNLASTNYVAISHFECKQVEKGFDVICVVSYSVRPSVADFQQLNQGFRNFYFAMDQYIRTGYGSDKLKMELSNANNTIKAFETIK